jgi:hypothetical protein
MEFHDDFFGGAWICGTPGCDQASEKIRELGAEDDVSQVKV